MGKIKVERRCRLHFKAREPSKLESTHSESEKVVPLPREVMDRLPMLSLEDKTTSIASQTGKKKDRRKLRHEAWLKKINVYQKAREDMKAANERKKTVVVGDVHPLIDALPKLELDHTETKNNKVSCKHPHRVDVKEVSHFHDVLKHPAYIEDPLTTISLHIENSLAQGLS